MKTFTNLYAALLEAHLNGLITLTTLNPDTFAVAFTYKVVTEARHKLYDHIKQRYTVQVWWHDANILYVQKSVTYTVLP